MQITQAVLFDSLDALVATGGPFDPAALWLGVASVIVNNGLNTVLADITPGIGTLATRKAIATWGPTYLTKNGLASADAPALTFTPTTSADADTIVGWYLADALTAGNLVGFGLLPLPVTLNGPENILTIAMRLTQDPLGRWDATVSWDD